MPVHLWTHRNEWENLQMSAATSIIDPDALLTEAQAAQVLGLSIRTLQSWRCRGDGPAFVRAGRAVRYRKTEINSWVDANTVRARATP